MPETNEFESLLTQYLDDMYALAIQLTRSKQNAEDLVQDLFVKISLQKYKNRQIKNPRAWLAAILYRLFVDRWRRDKNSPVQYCNETDIAQDNVICVNPGPLQQLELSRESIKLQQAISCLNERQYRALLLHDIEGYTYEEIAEVMDLPMGTVKSNLFRARDKLQAKLSHNDKKAEIDNSLSTLMESVE